MNTQTNLQIAEQILDPWLQKPTHPEPFRLDVWISPDDFYQAISTLCNARWGYLCAITGIDRPAPVETDGGQPQENHIEVLYSFAEGEAVTTIHVLLPYHNLSLPTICELIPSASMYERELMEMLGVDMVGTPDRDKLILPDEWPAGVYPLRKSFKGLNSISMEDIE